MSKRRRNRTSLALAESQPVAFAEKREPKPQVAPRIGYDGQAQAQGRWEQEYHPDLEQLEDRIERFNELRTGDSAIVGAMQKLWWPIARGTYTVDAQGKGDKRAQDAASLIRANVLRAGEPELSVYRMKTKWRDFLWECFTAEQFGFSIHEIVTRVQPGPLGAFRVLHHAAWLHPSSIYQFRVGRDGFLLGIVQRFQARWWEGEKKDDTERSFQFDDFIPAESLFVRVRNKEGSNHEGTAVLRGMYADAKRNQSFRNWQAIHAQRVAVGIPKISITNDAPPEIQERAIAMAKAMRGGAQDRLYVVEAPGVSVGWVDNGTGALDLSPMLRANEDRLRGVMSLEWAGLGLSGAGGSRAVGDVQQRPFWLMAEGTAESIVEDIQSDIVEPLHRSNFGDDVALPKLRVSDVSPIAISEIAQAADSGLIIITADDENDIRRSLKLRTLSDEEKAAHERLHAAKAKPVKPESVAAPDHGDDDEDDAPEKPKARPKPKGGASDADAPADAASIGEDDADAEMREEAATTIELAAKPKRERHPPSEFESTHCKLGDLEACYSDMERDVAQELRRIRQDAVDEALAATTIRGTRAKVPLPRKAKAAMTASLRGYADKARAIGRATMEHEIRSQVAALAPDTETESLSERLRSFFGLAGKKPFDPFAGATKTKRGIMGVTAVSDAISEELETLVILNVRDIMNAMIAGLEKEIHAQLAAEASDADAIDAARRVANERGEAPLEQAGRGIASRGVNGGRAEAAEEAMDALDGSGLRVDIATRTSVLEPSTCDECESLHGARVEVESDEYFALMPPAECEGGAYCRCVYVYSVERSTE